MSVVRLVASDEQRRPQARGGDVDRGVDLSYNGGGLTEGRDFCMSGIGVMPQCQIK